MRGGAFGAGVKEYVGWLLTVVLFPVAWLRAVRLARHHKEDDPRGPAKVVVAIGLSVVLTAGAALAFIGFHQDSTDGIYESLDGRLSAALGNEAYRSAVDIGDDETAARLEPNHELYLRVNGHLQARDDAAAMQAIASRGGDVDESVIDMERVDTVFAIKDKAARDLGFVMSVLVYPGLVGILFAPLVWAVGSVLNRVWTPSTSVGFKQYPSGAAAFFLLLGAFGVPALFFSAWVLRDLSSRSVEGQIAL